MITVGLSARTKPGRRLGGWIESVALTKLPLYGMFRNLAARFTGSEEELTHFRPVLVETWPNISTFAFVVEEHVNGDLTVFIPIAPTPSIGYVCIARPECIRMLDVPANKALGAVLSWGEGAAAVMSRGGRESK